jgi:uncharacterized membrane protein
MGRAGGGIVILLSLTAFGMLYPVLGHATWHLYRRIVVPVST